MENKKQDLNEVFEELWNKQFIEDLERYEKRTNKYLRWLGKPDWLDKNSNTNKLIKFYAHLFFSKGCLYESNYISNLLKINEIKNGR